MFEQPKENIVRSSARLGVCSTCGAKNVMVSAPPMGRHVDEKACEAQRALNRTARASGRATIGAKR